MRCVAPLLAAVLAVAHPLVAAMSEDVSRTPPPVYAEHIAGLLTPLDDVLPGRDAFPDDKEGGIVLLFEKVVFQGEDGLFYRLFHVVHHAVDQAGVEPLGKDVFSYDREREDIFLIDAASISPSGERMPVESKGAFIQTPQHEAENSLYTSQAELTVIYPRVAPGSVTEAVVLIRENQPVMPGEFALSHSFARGWPAHRQRLVIDLPESALARVKAVTSGFGVPEPRSERYAPGRERRIWERTGAVRVRWEENAPQFEFRAPTLWLSTLDSWDAVATWFHGLLAGRSELDDAVKAEIDRRTAGVTARDEIIAILTETVANEVRYVGLEFGLAGYQPHPCQQVWDTRYGDCKDKANLLRAMLAHKGITSHVTLIETAGLGRVQHESPSWGQFNHAILAIENPQGGYTFCDPTIKFLPAGSLGLADIGRDVLVVKPGKAEWTRTPDTLDSAIRIEGDLSLASDGALSGWFTLVGEGVDAAGYAEYLNNLDRDGRLRWMQRLIEGFFPGADVADIDFAPVTKAVRETRIRAYLTRGARASGDQALVFPYPANWLPSLDTAGERRFPYVTRRREESVAVGISLPPGWGAPAVPAAFTAPSAVADFKAGWTTTPGRIEARLAWHPSQLAVAPADYAVLQRSVRALTSWLEQPVVLEHRANGAAVVTTTGDPVLEGFPILPTGQGQLRLLNERFPQESRPRERRAALEKILQWFPSDADTVFEAQVLLATPEWEEIGDLAFADRMAALLQRHGSAVNAGLRTWAVYLEARGRWDASKDPAAIDRLEQLAADATLSSYRRGWSAVYAARFRRELDPRRALDFLVAHDGYESEARETIVRLIASLYAEVGDTGGLADWARGFVSRAGGEADALVAAAIDELIDEGDSVDEPRRTAALAALVAAAPDSEAHPKIEAERARWVELSSRRAVIAAYRGQLLGWLQENRPAWWTPERAAGDATIEDVIKRIEAGNGAHSAEQTADAAMQLVLHHDAEINQLAMYSRWTVWWLRRKELSTAFVDVIGKGVQALPPAAGSEVIEAWHEYALHLRATGRLDEARAIYTRVLEHPDAKDFLRVDAGGALADLEREAGNVEAALAAVQRIVPIHTTHKWGADRLYPAVLLQVQRGEYDAALRLIEAMRAQDAKYLETSVHKLAVPNLLRAAEQPEALRRYWERAGRWLESWNAVLEVNGLNVPAPHELPLESDFGGLNERLEKAVGSKNIAAYLQGLDTYARLARFIPLFGGDFCSKSDMATRIAPALAMRVCEVGIGLMEGAEPVDPNFDESAAVWKSVMLANVGRKDEAAACGREVFKKLGGEHAQGMAGLRLWALYSRGTAAEPEALATLDAVLASGREVPDRMLSMRVLSDAYWFRKSAAAQRTLIEREKARAGFDTASDHGTVLLARLQELDRDAVNGGALTAAIDAWLEQFDTGWLDHVPPSSLSEPRFANLLPPLLEPTESVSASEVLKVNLLAARDHARPADTRVRCFHAVVFDLAQHTDDVERLTEAYRSAAAITLLPEDRRARLLINAATTLIGRGDTPRLEKLIGDPLFSLVSEDRRRSLRAALGALKAADAGGDAWERAAYAALSDVPLDEIRVTCVGHIIARLAYAGEFERASGIVAAVKDASVDAATVDKSTATLRLGWTRLIRRVQDQMPFAQSVKELVLRHTGNDVSIPDAVRRRIRYGGSPRLSDRENVLEALHLLERGYLAGENFSTFALFALHDAPEFRRKHPELFPRILELALKAPGVDSDRASWVLAAAMGSDIDLPDVLEKMKRTLGKFRASSEAAERPETARRLALVGAYIALRTDRDPRPAAIFGALGQAGLPEDERLGLELHFRVTRGQVAEAAQLAESLPTAMLIQPQWYRLARNGLLAAGRGAEVELLDESMREQLARAMGDLWMHPENDYEWGWLQVARVLEADDLVPPAWFERAAATCTSEIVRAQLRIHEARMRQDWTALRATCDKVLRDVPDMYDVYYERAIARHRLGDKTGARDDLRVMLKHALSNEDYEEARVLLREIAPGDKLAERRNGRR